MTPPSLLPAPTAGSFVSSRETGGVVYCSVSARLKGCALTVADAVALSHHGGCLDNADRVICNVRYRSARIAARSCSTLQVFRRQCSTGEGGAVDAQPALVDSSGMRLQCTRADLLPNGDFRPLAQELAAVEVGTVIPFEKRLKNLAARYSQLFDPSLVVGITIDAVRDVNIARNEASSWVQRGVEDHRNLVDFSRLFVSLCSTEKPAESFISRPQHIVEIVDLATIIVNGARVSINAPRRAALFTLVVFGTENLSVEQFARVYTGYLTRTTNAVNYSNIFAQAMQGLQKSLPFLRVVKVQPSHRTILGLSVTSAVAPGYLEDWLRGRR